MKKKTIPTNEELRAARLAAGKTQWQVAYEIDLPRGQAEISEIERLGKHCKEHAIIEKFKKAVGVK